MVPPTDTPERLPHAGSLSSGLVTSRTGEAQGSFPTSGVSDDCQVDKHTLCVGSQAVGNVRKQRGEKEQRDQVGNGVSRKAPEHGLQLRGGGSSARTRGGAFQAERMRAQACPGAAQGSAAGHGPVSGTGGGEVCFSGSLSVVTAD